MRGARERAPSGILPHLQALSDLASRSDTVDIAWLVLSLLLLVIECLPVTVKLLETPDCSSRTSTPCGRPRSRPGK